MKKSFLLILSLLLILTLASCSNNEVIRIGFVGSLTGGFSDIGVPARNAVQLKIEEINENGGINGQDVELIIKDSQGNQDLALKAFEELYEKDVNAIIGPSLSGNTLHVLDFINDRELLTIGATITSTRLSGLDDYFLRVSQTNEQESIMHANYLIENGYRELVVVLDYRNEGYTKPWYDNFKEEFTAAGGQVIKEWGYYEKGEISYDQLAEDIIQTEVKALLTVTPAMETAMIAQQLYLKGYEHLFMTSGHAKTEELIMQGGRAVVGIISSHAYDNTSKTEELKNFEEDYYNRFSVEPNFAANYGYDAINVLMKAIQSVDDISPDNLKTELLNTEYPGVFGPIEFDKYGDIQRGYVMYEVIDGEFQVIDD